MLDKLVDTYRRLVRIQLPSLIVATHFISNGYLGSNAANTDSKIDSENDTLARGQSRTSERLRDVVIESYRSPCSSGLLDLSPSSGRGRRGLCVAMFKPLARLTQL